MINLNFNLVRVGVNYLLTGYNSNNHNINLIIPSSIGINSESTTENGFITEIGTLAFNNLSLNSLIIGNKITTIDEYAFSNNSLSNITFTDNLINIKNYAFINNPIDKIINLNNLYQIGDFAFYNNNLTNIQFSNFFVIKIIVFS
jgi:hypothetical protein